MAKTCTPYNTWMRPIRTKMETCEETILPPRLRREERPTQKGCRSFWAPVSAEAPSFHAGLQAQGLLTTEGYRPPFTGGSGVGSGHCPLPPGLEWK